MAKKRVLTESEREKIEIGLFGRVLTPEEREAKSGEYLNLRTEEYPWQTVTWEGSEDEIPLRDQKKMKPMNDVCRNLVLD